MTNQLLFLDHVTADVPSPLLRGSLSNETQLPRARLADAVFRRAVFVVGTLGNGHSVVALHVRIRAKDLCKNCRGWRKPLALAFASNTSERISLPARLQIQLACNALANDAHSTRLRPHLASQIFDHLFRKTDFAGAACLPSF